MLIAMNIKTLIGAIILAAGIFAGCEEPEYEFYSTITGTVCDFSTGEALQNASVVLSPSNMTVMTTGDGSFIFENLDAGQYSITVQKEGYYVDRKTVTAISGETITTDILLKKI